VKITFDLIADLYQINTLTSQDINQIHILIIDYFAAACAGYKQNRLLNNAIENIIFSQKGIQESSVLFQSRRYPAAKAAFMNSVYGHGAELDDGNKRAAGHCGVHIIPAVFALADKLLSSNDDVLNAIATGYEAFIRISSAVQPGLIQRGFHSTGMAGTLACAVACAKLYHLNPEGMEHSLALSTTLSGGLLSYGDSCPAIKPLNPGKAAENGVFAAMLAHEGVKGPEAALEGHNGWFHAVTNKFDENMLKDSDHLLLHDCYLKLYPSCRHTHCCIEAAINLSSKVKIEEIKIIKVYIYPNAIKLAGQIRFPKNVDETKFSIHYTLAYALKNGRYDMTDINSFNCSKEFLELISKIELIADEKMENKSKGIRGAKVIIVNVSGEVLEETILMPKGDPEKPLNSDEVFNKLYKCAESHTNMKKLDKLIHMITNISGNNKFLNPMALLGETEWQTST
jgi:2-methylcitrate dehydratase PrpD